MKRVLLQTVFFACFSLLCGMAYGQTGYLYQNDIEGWQDKIRYHSNGGNYVTCSQPSLLARPNHFAITDIHNYMIDAHVADGYFVQDFEIIDDYVFFCGYNGSMSGFLGWFDINDVFYGTGSSGRAHIDATLGTYGIEELDNIEVYYDAGGRIHIAGVGRSFVSGVWYNKAFEAVGYTPNTMQYRVVDLNGSGSFPELTVTNDFVVYLTGERNNCNIGIGYMLEPFPKNDMFALPMLPSFLFQTVATGTCIPPDAFDPYLDIAITHKENNTIAVCNCRCGFVPLSYSLSFCSYTLDNNFWLVYREYDLAPLLAGNPIQMITDNRINLPLGGRL